jgi:hypothetical protein
MGDESARPTRDNRAVSVIDDLPLSPELVLVSPPDAARLARAALPDPQPAPVVRVEPGLSRGEIAAVYAVSLAVTVVPLALTLLSLPSRS